MWVFSLIKLRQLILESASWVKMCYISKVLWVFFARWHPSTLINTKYKKEPDLYYEGISFRHQCWEGKGLNHLSVLIYGMLKHKKKCLDHSGIKINKSPNLVGIHQFMQLDQNRFLWRRKIFFCQFGPTVFSTLYEHGALMALCSAYHSTITAGRDSTWWSQSWWLHGREGAGSECAGPSVSVPASHGQLPDKPIILTGQISAERLWALRGFAPLIWQSHPW